MAYKKLTKPAFLLVDAMALIFRSYFAIPSLTNSQGTPTNAVHGFFAILFKLLDELKPDRIAICFDRKETTRRKAEYSEYKAQRDAPPSELIQQIPLVKEGVEAMNLNIIEKPGLEADDLIATICYQNHNNHQFVIYSSDFDLLQLANQDTFILTPHNQKQGLLIDEQEVIKKYGITPLQIPDYKGLCGDSSDNLPGVKGIGKKTATKMLQEYGSLEKVYENLDQFTPATRKKLETDQEMAYLCKRLATLITDAEFTPPTTNYQLSEFCNESSKQFFQKYELHNLQRKVFHNSSQPTPETKPNKPEPTTNQELKAEQPTLF